MTVCNITGWQCHCQPPEILCDGLAELRKAYAEWRALAERRKQELSLAEEGLANYAQENEQLKAQPFRERLNAEIAKQEALIKRMDYPPNVDMWGNGIMTDIRQERLNLLKRLLDFEPSCNAEPQTPPQT